MADLSKVLVKNLSVAVLYDSRARVSFCWKLFGHLIITESNKRKILNPDQVFCLACLNAVKSESEDITFGAVKIKQYNKTVSTGNLTRHLRDDHKIRDDRSEKHERKDKDLLVVTKAAKALLQQQQTTTITKPTYEKRILARDVAIWCCNSLLPIDYVSDVGMVAFLKKHNIIQTGDELPSRSTVTTSLDEVYECLMSLSKDKICLDDPLYMAMTCELWTDQYRQLNYITLRLQYLTPDFELKIFTLNTQMIEEKITREKIAIIVNDARRQFGIIDKNIYAVTNVGGIVMQAADPLTDLENHLCLGHGFHKLVVVDGIRTVPELQLLVEKCKKIVMAVSYRMSALEVDAKKSQMKILSSLQNVIQTLEADEINPITDSSCLPPDPLGDGVDEVFSSFTKNHTATPTRWHSILEMSECLIQVCSRDPINKLLKRIDRDDLQITQYEWNLLEDLVNFMKSFREAVEVLSSQKTCTINVALLFRSEIIDVLNSVSDEESIIISSLKSNMLANIDKRFPVTKAVVAATLLDNRFMNIKEVDKYLESVAMNRTTFLASYIKETMTDLKVAPKSENVEYIASTSSKDTSILHKLMLKHRVSSCQDGIQNNPIDQECWRYVAAADPTEPKDGDLLSYWNRNKTNFPRLSALAKALLCIPATSTPSQEVFSVAGLAASAKRTRLSPMNINKFIFVHDNFKEL